MSATPEAHVSLLCFDFGTRQIGVAYGQTVSGTAQPVAVLRARDGQPRWEQVMRLVAEWQPQRLLVGWPLNMDGTESEFCARARRFAGRLHARTGKPVTLVDERLSTAEAKRDSDGGRDHRHNDYRRHPVDGLAAALILRTWLSEPAAGRDL